MSCLVICKFWEKFSVCHVTICPYVDQLSLNNIPLNSILVTLYLLQRIKEEREKNCGKMDELDGVDKNEWKLVLQDVRKYGLLGKDDLSIFGLKGKQNVTSESRIWLSVQISVLGWAHEWLGSLVKALIFLASKHGFT